MQEAVGSSPTATTDLLGSCVVGVCGGERRCAAVVQDGGHRQAETAPRSGTTVRCFESERTQVFALVDTIVIEPDQGIFTLTWRAVLPMRRSCFDIQQVIVGEKSEAWQRARKYGRKPYYKGLAELVRARRRGE